MAVNFTVEHKRTSEYRFYPEHIAIRAELNGRHDKPEIEWLINDILEHGQHTPVVIRNDGGSPVLVAGFSRWRAISEINRRKLSPVPMQLRATYVQCSESEAFILNISENRFRNETTPIDDSHNLKRLINNYGMTEEQAAKIYFPTAATEAELKSALKFVRERIALISLTPEAEAAVRSGRVQENAATAIAKLSEDQQRKLIASTDGPIKRSDVTPRKAPRRQDDRELMRRLAAMLEDIDEAKLRAESYPDAVVPREKLIALYDYWTENK